MKKNRLYLVGVAGATLALILAGTAAVTAAPGNQNDLRGFGPGGARMPFQRGDMGFRGGFGIANGDVVRTETTVQDGNGVVTVYRVDNGTSGTTSDTSLDYTLATGETASVTVDGNTQVYNVTEQSVAAGRRGLMRQRLVPESIAVTDIAAGSDVTVWATSQADGSYLAQRIVVQPAATASSSTDDSGATSDSGSTSDSSTVAPVGDA